MHVLFVNGLLVIFALHCSAFSFFSDIDFNFLHSLYNAAQNVNRRAAATTKAARTTTKSSGKTSKVDPKLDGNLSQSYFNALESYQVGATAAKSSDYPWIARVIHSRNYQGPHMCTAACIDTRIFITAARCIASLKIDFTTVKYKTERFPAQAFVLSANQSKQLFDDIGFIVVENIDFREPWTFVKFFPNVNRTDDNFMWFDALKINPNAAQFKVVGFATDKGIHRIKSADRKFHLTELPVFIDLNMCSTIFTFKHNSIRGFYVPCYHSCSHTQFNNHTDLCKKHHGVEGGAIIHKDNGKLLGIATWGAYFSKYELPVGFSVPNSRKFYQDYECARRIRNDNSPDSLLLVRGYYQNLCETINK